MTDTAAIITFPDTAEREARVRAKQDEREKALDQEAAARGQRVESFLDALEASSTDTDATLAMLADLQCSILHRRYALGDLRTYAEARSDFRETAAAVYGPSKVWKQRP